MPLLAAYFALCPSISANISAGRTWAGAYSQDKKQSRLSLPQGESAWLLRLTTLGGFLGGGGSIVITSDGDVSAGRGNPYACMSKVPPAELKELVRLLRAAESAEWEADTSGDGESPGRDQVKVTLELRRRDVSGAPRISRAVWYNGQEGRVPSDLLALKTSVSRLEKSVVRSCASYR